VKDALIEGARRWDYMMVGNEKERSGVVPATLFFCFLGWRWWMVDGGLGPAKRLPVCLVGIKVGWITNPEATERIFLLGGKQINHNPAMQALLFLF